MYHIIFQDSGTFRDMNHLFHFVEHVMVSFTYLYRQKGTRYEVHSISFPHLQQKDWQGKFHQHNLRLLHYVYPNAKIVEKSTSPYTIISDRNHLYTGPFNKMITTILRDFPLNEWFNIFFHIPVSIRQKPKVVYISRQKCHHRKLSLQEEEFLHFYLHNMHETIDYTRVWMEDLSFQEQLRQVRQADILIGVHGNGLTHCMFMKPKSILLEIFPSCMSTYLYDYYFLSLAMNHQYYALLHKNITFPSSIVPPHVKHDTFSQQLENILENILFFYK